jgi:hypothetical protein
MVDESLLNENGARIGRRGVAIDAHVAPGLDRCLAVGTRQLMADATHGAPRIGMPGRDVHASRPTHASQLVDEGGEIVTIRKRLLAAKPDIAIGPQTSIGLERAICD